MSFFLRTAWFIQIRILHLHFVLKSNQILSPENDTSEQAGILFFIFITTKKIVSFIWLKSCKLFFFINQTTADLAS